MEFNAQVKIGRASEVVHLRNPTKPFMGAVINAYDWVFLKLEGDTVFVDKERYFLNDFPTILGIFQFIIDQYKD